jgi:hypothetical protein
VSQKENILLNTENKRIVVLTGFVTDVTDITDVTSITDVTDVTVITIVIYIYINIYYFVCEVFIIDEFNLHHIILTLRP